MTLEEGEESSEIQRLAEQDSEEVAEDAGMWRRLAGFCKKLYEKVQQTWWRVRP